MMSLNHRVRKDGTIAIKVGRTTTVLKTASEADAFMAGVKTAHIQLANEILPILKIKDGRHD